MIDVKKLITSEKLIVIVRGVTKEILLPLATALHDGGIRCMEITYCADGSVSDEETANQIRMLSKKFGTTMAIGAGTVLTETQVKLTKHAGGTFVISPNTDEKLIKEAHRQGLISIPGALTPTEIAVAREKGADFIKLFPANFLTPEYVKAVTAPLSDVNLLSVGGINENNMREYLKAGVCGFGLGSNIIKKDMIATNNFAGITALAKEYVQKIKELSNE